MRGGMAMAPRATRGWGMVAGTDTTGAPHDEASFSSSPPLVMATTRAPFMAASVAASRHFSVSPEKEMANTSEPSPTKAGHSYDLTTVTGTRMNGAALATSLSRTTPG